jgi:hypothetical protein
LIFPLVLSFASRQRKVRSKSYRVQQNLKELLFDDVCPFSFARPKENGQKVSALRHPASLMKLL